MSVEIKVPTLGESVASATVARWMKKPGEPVAADEPVVELETDKVTVEVPSPAAGVIESVVAAEGTEVSVGAVLGTVSAGASATARSADAPKPEPVASPGTLAGAARPPLPAAAKLMADSGLAPGSVVGTGKSGQVTKADVLKVIEGGARQAPAPAAPDPKPETAPKPAADGARRVERVKMSRLRQTIARRLKEAQNTAAILTTFNEIDMSAVMALRARYRDAFEKRHGVRLGFMGFFVKAAVAALRDFPAVNAAIEGEEILFHHYMDIGIAVSGPSGLVVPVLRNAETLSLAAIEAAIAEFGRKARDGTLTLEDMAGGTFSITNGGVFGSLMSTPILNPPQSAILGMHKIEERPVAVGGKVEIRPMMYVALSYDHRIIDGREAVGALVRIKEAVEAPERLLLEV